MFNYVMRHCRCGKAEQAARAQQIGGGMENQSSIKQIKHLEFDTFKLSFLLLIV
jgi:hypothetical protein